MRKMICQKPVSWITETATYSDTINKSDSQLIYGEVFISEKKEGAYVLGHSALDNYSGYVLQTDLKPAKEEELPTHTVIVPLTHLYPLPTFKSKPVMALPLLSRVSLKDNEEGGFTETKEGGWIFTPHLQEKDSGQLSYLETAQKFIHVPYLYGGQSISGIDCSGLVRVSLLSAGIACPRDCDRQIQELPYDISNTSTLKRGDVVYVHTHVVIMLDNKTCINATARHMCAVIEPFTEIMKAYKEILAIKRFI